MSLTRFSDALYREAMRPVRTQTTAVNLATTGDVTLLSASGRGVLSSLGFRSTTTIASVPVFNFTITIDGGTPMVISWLNGGLNIEADMASLVRFGDNNPGITSGEPFGVEFGNIPFNVSCTVVLNRATAASAGVGNFTTVHHVPA